jgi:hypothetical protein
MSRKSAPQFVVKTLNPKDEDSKYYGTEPEFKEQPTVEGRTSALTNGLRWYSRFFGRKDAKELMIQYTEFKGNPEQGKLLRKVEDSEIAMSLCWLARMNMRGLVLTDEEQSKVNNELFRVTETFTNPQLAKASMTSVAKTDVKEVKETNRPNVQEIMREKASEVAGELEGIFDEYIKDGAKANHSFKIIDEVKKKNILSQHISIISDVWKKKLAEFSLVLEGKDSDLAQGYAFLTKTQIKNIIKFIEQVLSELNSYISVKKTTRAPRARKPISVEKQVSKLKYLRAFKDEALKLDLISIHPTKLHGASECYLYDTSKRKLIYLCADEYSKTFTVKGTTILGFDISKSQVKTLRKPSESLPALMKLGKPAGRKFFSEIKAVGTTPNGRTNENLIILKTF